MISGDPRHRRRARDRPLGPDRREPELPLALLVPAVACSRAPRRRSRRSPSRRCTTPAGSTGPARCCSRRGSSRCSLGVSQGAVWGWTSPRRSACSRSRSFSAAAWVGSSRARQPLVDMQMMRRARLDDEPRPRSSSASACSARSSSSPRSSRCPSRAGVGFGASVTQAGLYLLPTTAGMLIVSPISGRLVEPDRRADPADRSARSRPRARSSARLRARRAVADLRRERRCSASASALRSRRWRT